MLVSLPPDAKSRMLVMPFRITASKPLAAGSTSSSHREALLFAAGEYDRVVGLAVQPEQEAVARRAADKSEKLRELANQ